MPDPALTAPVFATFSAGAAQLERITRLVERWVRFGAECGAAVSAGTAAPAWVAVPGECDGFDSLMWQQFLDEMQKAGNQAALGIGEWAEGVSAVAPHCHAVLAAMDAACAFAAQRNAEIRFRWLILCIRAALPASEAPAHAFLGEYGRMKFVRRLRRTIFYLPLHFTRVMLTI